MAKILKLPNLVLTLVVSVTLIIAATYSTFWTYESLTKFTLERRAAIAYLAATTLKEKFDAAVGVGISFSTRIQFRKLIEEGKWQEAMQIVESGVKDFSYLDRTFIFDPEGILKASSAPVTAEIQALIGTSFAYRDYYQGVSKNWQPYLAEVVKPAAPLGYNLVPIAIPIKSSADGRVLGFLLLTMKLDTVSAWSKNIDVGQGGFVYIVDQKGHLAAHPNFSKEKEIVDFSQVPAVQKVLKGESGVETLSNPIEKTERVTAYEPVPEYGWGVIVVQPTDQAFSYRNNLLIRMALVWVLVSASLSVFTFIILRNLKINRLRSERERTFLESIADGIVAVDKNLIVTLWNKAASQITEYTAPEALGKNFKDVVKLIKASDKKEDISFIESAINKGESQKMSSGTLLITKTGRELTVADSCAPIFSPSGKVSGAIIVFRDISKEDELQKAKEEFLSLITHQLRTPLTGIKGYSSMLLDGLDGKLNAEQKEDVEKIFQATEANLEMVTAMLNVYRMELGALAIEPVPSDLVKISNAVVEELSPKIKEKSLKLKKDYQKDLPKVSADPKIASAILMNLISNSIKYTNAGDKVSITIAKKDQDIQIEVNDTGIGIPKAQQDKVFTKLFRADNVMQRGEGTGLGLYIVKSAVEAYGGKIWFESEENRGTTFYFTIPLSGMKKKEGLKGLT